ncbi:MAG: cytotoxin [Elusimicrobia bacterium]|nr:cytotoxin [Elusimicrobiota bacterium]
MKVRAYDKFRDLYRKLPSAVRRKALRQIHRLSKDQRHPSLQVKRIQGTAGIWEARVDIRYRMTFEIAGGDTIVLRVIGDHDEALRRP